MPYSLTDMVLYFFMYSFCGWLMETVLCSIREHRFINRGFLNGPLCPIYGCGILLILTFLLPVRDSIPRAEVAVPVIFLAGAVLASAVEYFTSWAMEKLFHARWWDYSSMHFNLNGRVCLAGFLVFGAFGLILLEWIQPWLESKVGALGEPLTWGLTGAFLALSISDAFATVRHVLRLDERLGEVQEEMERFLTEARARGEQWALEANLAAGQLRHSTPDGAPSCAGASRKKRGLIPKGCAL